MSAPTLSAVERLALSREKLRSAMRQATHQPAPDIGVNTQLVGVLAWLKTTLPHASFLIDALGLWWTTYAAQEAGQTAVGVADHILKPLAKRHPLLLVVGAVAVGGLLAWSRPWRWALKPPVLAAWGPALVSGVLASGSVQVWLLSVLSTLTDSAKKPNPPDPDPTPR